MRVEGSRRATLVEKRLASAREMIGTLTPGIRIVGVTAGQFSLIDLVEAVSVQCAPADVLICCWSTGLPDMERVFGLQAEPVIIERFRLLIDKSFPARYPSYVARITEAFGPDAIRMTRTHAKFACISGGDYRITIRTSMNLGRNPRLEQFDLDDNAELHSYFCGVADEFFARVPPGLQAAPSQVADSFRHTLKSWGADGQPDDHLAELVQG